MKLSLLSKSNLISIFFSKKVFLCLVFLCFVGSVFCTEYVWKGTESTNWVEAEDWKAEDKVVIDNDQTYTISSNCSVGELVLNVGSKLIISEGVTVNIGYLSIYGELTNNGTIGKIEGRNNHIVIASNASLINAGTISQNSLEMNFGSTMQNLANSAITFGAVKILSGAVLDNLGDMIIEGESTNTGTIKNSGFLDLKGPLVNNSNGILENNGEIESLSEITNQSGGSITNNSSGTISGNINNTGSFENTGGITGAITNNAGGTVTDSGTISDGVSGDGTYEDNHIVVKTYSTISSDTVLDWNDDSSWENGEKPDISGDTAVEITLNANVSIEDFQAFFSEGNEKITLNGTGNLLYNGKKIYISQKSDTELDWNTAENWINGIVPIITGEERQEVVIVLNSNFISSETLVFNSATGAAIHIYLCGKIISAESVQLVSDWTHPQNNPAGNIHFYGSGTVEIKSLDASNNTNRTSTHRISLYDETIFKITEHAYADPARGEIIDTTGNCEVYLPASGFDMRVPSGKNDGATFVVVGTQAKAIEPQSYYKIEVTTDISATEKIFTFSRSEAGKHNYDLNIPYVVYLMGDASWKLGDTKLTDVFEGNVTIPGNNTENGTSQIEQKILLSNGTVKPGDGIKIVFYTPCKNLVLKEFIYEKEIIYWTGDVSEDFLTPSNWSLSGTPLGSLDELTGKTVKIPSNCTNYPKLSSDISLEKLVVEDGAEVTILDNGKLTVEKIHIYDSGALKAESGTVVFSGENPSYFAKYPEFSKFGTIEVQSGTFNLNYPLTLTQLNIASGAKFSTTNELVISSVENSGDFSTSNKLIISSIENNGIFSITTAELYIKKSLTNNGTFQAEKVYLEPIENEITITGQSGDPSETANETKISELYCISQAGKNLVINNAISVGKIALSGSSDNRLSIRGNGIIYLETECGDDENDIAQYLDLDENSLPKIENQYITVSDGQFSSENNDIFVEKHWINGDAIEYKWVGGASGNENNWNERTNWNIRKVPGEDKNVIIPACQNPPILAGQSVTVKTIENNGTIDFAGSTVKTDSITNNGTVKLTGKETFKKQDDTKISLNNGEASTVIYYGSNENAKFVWGGNYEKLVIEDGFSGSFTPSGIFQSSTSFSVANSIEVENSKVFTKKDDTKDYVLALGGAVKIENKIDSLTIDSEGDQNYNFDIEFEESVVLQSKGSINFPENSEKIFKNGLKLETTKDFSNTGKLISENGDISIISASFENSGKLSGKSGEITATTKNALFTESSEVVFANEFTVDCKTAFSNGGTIEVGNGLSINSETCKIENEISAKNITIKSATLESSAKLIANEFLTITANSCELSGEIVTGKLEISCDTLMRNCVTSITHGNVAGNLFVLGETSITFSEKLEIGSVENSKDMVITALESDIVKQVSLTGGKINVSGNFALFNGNLKLYADLSIEKDMILLNGKTSGVNSIYKDNITEIEGLFAYHLNGRPVSCNLETFPTENPINNAQISHEEYKSTLTLADNLTISVGKNFYSNRVDLGTNTTGSWYLKFPANDAATSSFAECYNATIKNCIVSANTTPGEAWLATENCTDGTGNTNVAFSKAIFANVATITDNIIRVSFVDGNSTLDEKPEIKIENSCNEISAWALTDNFRFNISQELPEGIQFTGVYANPECTKSTDGKGDLSTFYLKYEIPTDGSIDYRWNTDATGSDPGAEESTDTSGVHKNVVPNLAFKRTIEASYAGLRDEHKNRLVSVGTNTAGSEPLFEATKDEAPPVLIAVTFGQEQHETEAASQHHYDSHNFIEWQFSEPVEFENYPENGISQIEGVDTSANSENIQSTENFGKITNQENGFSVAGFGTFENGKVTVGSKTGSGEVNALYRKFALEAGKTATAQEFRIRLSIAGYVDEGNPVTVNGVDYKNWLGFIDSKNTTIPSGTFTMKDSAFLSIKDKSENKNPLVPTKNQPVTVNKVLPSMAEEIKGKTLYGTWDIDPPVVANYMKEDSSNIYAQELIAVNNTSGEIAESLELHFLDNSVYNKYEGKENLQWRTKIGWIENNVQINQTIPLDIRGGSRMVSTENQTYGGVRFSTLVDVLDSFVCKNLTTGENIVLNELSQSTTNEVIFGESDENQFDVPYLTLKFENAKGSLLKHNFELEYNKNSQKTGFITDLAGNLLYEFSVKSPDKNPPQILLSIGGVNHDSLYILFSKPIDYLNQNQEPDEGKLRRIVKSLSIFESSSDGKKDTELISYKLGSQAKVVTETKESTGIEISLTRSVSYDELKNLYIGVNSFESGSEDEDGDSSQGDPITGEMGKYSMLYDMFENPISEDSKHCFSDFAVNAFDVLYAYDGRAIEDAALNQGVFGGNQWTVTDFSGEINNSSKVIAGKDITIAGKIVDFSDNPDNQDKFSMLADISPSKNKAGLDFTDYSGINTRLWFSDFVKYFPVNNSITSNNYTTDNLLDNGKIETSISGKDNQSFTYVIPNEKEDSQSVNWVDGDEFEFLFKILDSNNEVIMVDGNVDGDTDDEVDHPLFALRLKDENDITSIDLWSLHVVELLRQKGGATILNNVINSLNNEETAIEIQVPQTGFLTVQVLTLDGNVVKVLQKGRVEEGTYYYKWNGTNNSGAAVARGMYFIRVVGPKIDETRKVMVIKE